MTCNKCAQRWTHHGRCHFVDPWAPEGYLRETFLIIKTWVNFSENLSSWFCIVKHLTWVIVTLASALNHCENTNNMILFRHFAWTSLFNVSFGKKSHKSTLVHLSKSNRPPFSGTLLSQYQLCFDPYTPFECWPQNITWVYYTIILVLHDFITLC